MVLRLQLQLQRLHKNKKKVGWVILIALITGKLASFQLITESSIPDEKKMILTENKTHPPSPAPSPAAPRKRPLQVFPLLKELRAGWGNMQVPPLLKRNAENTRALIVDVGLDQGEEFFYALNQGFEMVGFEPNPVSFKTISAKCNSLDRCEVVDLATVELPLKRKPSHSYLFHAGVGATRTELEISVNPHAPLSTFADLEVNKDGEKAKVPVLPIDLVIDEDVFLFKIDTQGFEHFVLEGAKKLFENHVVRQLIFEMDPYLMNHQGLNIKQTLEMVQEYGMLCFADRNDSQACDYLGDSAEGLNEHYFNNIETVIGQFAKCWDDFLCINIEKEYDGDIPPLL
jgi:FkbM family methyltransferase